jgi:HEAT repeat protein
MIAALASVDALLAAAVLLLGVLIISIRFVALRRNRWENRLRPATELALADYLAGSGGEPSPATREERAVLLSVAFEVLTDVRGAERVRMVALLEKLGYVAEAEAELGGRSPAHRQQAAETLSALATPSAVSALGAGLADSDAMVRMVAARTLAAAGGGDVIPAVVAAARHDMIFEPGAAAAVMLALGMQRPAELAPLLARQTAPEVRRAAVAVAGELRLTQFAPELRDCLAEDDILAGRAARGLGRIGDMTAVDALSRLAEGPQRPAVTRAAAVTALGAVGDPATCPLLESLLQAQDWLLVAASAAALAQLGEPGSGALRRAATSPRADVAALAQAALDR